MNDYLPVSEEVTRQTIDATGVFRHYQLIAREYKKYSGGMYWKKEGVYEYLVKTGVDNNQTRIGRRSSDTEQTFSIFAAKKSAAEEKFRAIKATLETAERKNRALRVGRVPNIVVDILSTIEGAGLSEYFTVVGTHALYAFETAGGVRISDGAMETQDIDLLWDARKRVQFFIDMQKSDVSMLDLLRKVDKTFDRREDRLETAVNARGFEVDFIRRETVSGDPHPILISDDENDLWPIQATRANVLTDAPKFSQVIISTTGRMATMTTVDPAVFVEFKYWMSEHASDRPHQKRRRDRLQAAIIKLLLDEGLILAHLPQP